MQNASLLTVNFKNTVALLFLMVFSVSCQDLKKTRKPDDLIPESKMIDVLTEISILQAARNYNKFKLEETGIKPDQYIYEKFDIDSLQFERSSNYYAEQYTQYERIYDSVKARIQRMKTRLDSLRDLEIKREDSIKKAQKDSLELLDSLGIDRDSLETEIKKQKKSVRDSLLPIPKRISRERDSLEV
ncbi:DUF4296 domain-containing protein [Gramella jeungdoensis]|uniref:DUF4296 domain-containing protein n=1 Tax=Gramella jeungdoensis TaxID=708091 RepID=A0ABT0YZY7_9FLAO|nr:DUF4296 domain-containing protein [Gramella jeungdoensis]MCM8568708.1 DUF4296 domain-containing protein [Gramella jeungdoensis]